MYEFALGTQFGRWKSDHDKMLVAKLLHTYFNRVKINGA